MMKRKKLLKLIMLLLIVFGVFYIFGNRFLVVDERPKKADVIIVLSGGDGRLEKAADLYKEGYAEYVLLTRANVEYLKVEEAVRLGIPESQLILEELATSTYTNAVYSKELMEKHQLESAIVVSSDFHMRRTKLIYDRVFQDSGIELTYVAAPVKEEVGEIDARTAIREYVKLIGYLIGLYHFIDLEE